MQIGGVIVLIYLVKKRAVIEEENIENFITTYGVIFDEFKSYDILFWVFYLLYIARRLFITSAALFLENGPVQLTTSFIFSLSVLSYTLFTMCFKNLISNIYTITNEVLHLVTLILLFNQTLETTSDPQNYSDLIIRTVTAAWALNILYNVTLLASRFKQKFFRAKLAKVADIGVLTSNETHILPFPEHKIYPSAENSVKPD